MRPLVAPFCEKLVPYVPGKPIEETEREYGVTNIAKLASNENCLGPSPLALKAIEKALAKTHLYPDAEGFYLKQRLAKLHDVEPRQIVELGEPQLQVEAYGVRIQMRLRER